MKCDLQCIRDENDDNERNHGVGVLFDVFFNARNSSCFNFVLTITSRNEIHPHVKYGLSLLQLVQEVFGEDIPVE